MKTLLACLFAGALAWLSPSAGAVGFAMLQIADGAEPALEVGIWYPSDAATRPTQIGLLSQDVAMGAPAARRGMALVVLSHGNGGNAMSHAQTALALAQAGFVVAAPTHTGDNHRDQSRAADIGGRTRHLVAVIDHMVQRWSPGAVDAGRVGAFGFSSGGLTVLAAAGAVPDLSLIGPHCAEHPRMYACQVLGQVNIGTLPAQIFMRDARLRVLVVAAPALGFTFTPAALAAVTMPVQFWEASDDAILPPRLYADPVRTGLPRPPEAHVAERAGHFDFMGPCSEALARAAPAICTSAPGFDRAAFQARFNAEVVRFLTAALGR